MQWPDCETQEACHIHAAQALVAKFVKEDAEKYGTHVNPWSLARVCGSIPSGEYVHVFVPYNIQIPQE